MAWIESHQQLREHPKVLRLGRLLDVPRTSAVGLLHFLWWWALDHAEDGDVTDFDCLDIALAAGWEGDPDTFVDALTDCGPGDRAGFLERVGGRLVLHDWQEYAGKLVDRRVKDRERKKAQRETSEPRPKDVRGTSGGIPTVQNSTQQNLKDPPSAPDGTDVVDDGFEDFWNAYPRHHDTKATGGGGNKRTTRKRWRALSKVERDEVAEAVGPYAKLCAPNGQKPKHAERFLINEAWQPYLPAARDGPPRAELCPLCDRPLADPHHEELCAKFAPGPPM